MPFVGQDKFNSAIRTAIENASQQMQRVRRGEWGKVPQESSAQYKAMLAKKRNMERWSENQQQINKQ